MAVPSPRTLDQILAENASIYNPQVQSLQTQIQTIPTQLAAQESGLAAKQQEAFGDILSGARRRGTGIAFGGIPLAEQSKYTASTYMPALAQLKQAGIQQQTSLQDAINSIRERQQSAALGQQQYEQQRYDAYEESLRQAAASQANIGQYLQALGSSTADQTAQALQMPKIQTSKNSSTGGASFNFTDYQGKPVNAAQYVQLYNLSNPTAPLSYRQLLQQMANDGDVNAKLALNYVGDDAKFGGAPSQYRSSLEALGATGTYLSDAQRNISNTPVNVNTSGTPLDKNLYAGLYRMYGAK